MKKIILMLLAVAALTSCSKFEPANGDETGSQVKLSGVINSSAATRVGGVIDPGVALSSLYVFRADQDASSNWPTTYTSNVGGSLAIGGSISTTPHLYYQTNASQASRFIGLYPGGGTVNYSTDATVSYTLDGSTDIMGTSYKEGNKGTAATPIALGFEHLLTKIEVEVKVVGADDTERAEISNNIWGAVNSIAVAGKQVTAVVTLPDPTDATALPTVAATGATNPLTLTSRTGGATTPVTMLADGSATRFGYAMFIPVGAPGEQLTLNITTANVVGSIESRTTRTDLVFDRGCGYKITVAFSATSVQIASVIPTGTIAGWDDTALTSPEAAPVQ
jgi:hypothetical protein